MQRCPSIVPELSPSSVYSRRFRSYDSSRKSLSLRVWPTGCDDGLANFFPSNPVGDASSDFLVIADNRFRPGDEREFSDVERFPKATFVAPTPNPVRSPCRRRSAQTD
jgi:hypothetical protein